MKVHLYSIMLLFALVGFSTTYANAQNQPNQLIGEWIYEVSDAPDAYKTGSLIFSEKEGIIVCNIQLEAGVLATDSLKIDNEKVTFTAYVDGSPVNVVLTRIEDKLSGTVESPEGPKEIMAIRKTTEKIDG